MALVYLGELSVGACMPAATAALASAYADLAARVAALAAFEPQPVNFGAQLTLLNSMIVNIQAMITLGISPPSIAAQIVIVAALVAALEAELAVVLGLQNALLVAGVFAYVYTGATSGLAPALSAAVSGGFPGSTAGAASNVLILGTVSPDCWIAMQAVFRTS